MKLLSAILDEDKADLHLTIHTDDTALIPDPEWVRPTKEVEGVVRTDYGPDGSGEATPVMGKLTVPDEDAVHPLIPDPSFIRTVTYGAQPRGRDKVAGAGETKAQYRDRLDRFVRGALQEERRLIRAEQRRSAKPEDLAKDPTETAVTDLVTAPIDLDTATLTVP